MIPMMNEYKNLIINFVKEHQKGLKIALLVFLVGGMIFKGLMQIPQINASKAEVAGFTDYTYCNRSIRMFSKRGRKSLRHTMQQGNKPFFLIV